MANPLGNFEHGSPLKALPQIKVLSKKETRKRMQELKSTSTNQIPKEVSTKKEESIFLKKRSLENSSDDEDVWLKQAMQKASAKRLDVSSSQIVTNKTRSNNIYKNDKQY